VHCLATRCVKESGTGKGVGQDGLAEVFRSIGDCNQSTHEARKMGYRSEELLTPVPRRAGLPRVSKKQPKSLVASARPFITSVGSTRSPISLMGVFLPQSAVPLAGEPAAGEMVPEIGDSRFFRSESWAAAEA
jgi:hypothetical protein